MDQARRKELLQQYRADEHEQARRRLGLSEEALHSLLDHLDAIAEEASCDHSQRETRAWATSQGLDSDVVTEAVAELGGYCDCEVLANVTPDKFGWGDRRNPPSRK